MKILNYLLLILIIFFGGFYVFQKNNLTANALVLEKEKTALAEVMTLDNNNGVDEPADLESIKELLGMQEVRNISFLIIGPANLALERNK